MYTRRKLLYDLGVASASTAGLGMLGCSVSHPPSDIYVLLQGPWLLSVADDCYLRAATTKVELHCYHYFDPHPNPWPPAVTGDLQDSTPTLNASASIDLSAARLLHFEVRRKHQCRRPVSERRQLFAAMLEQAQGLFYTNEVYCPEIFDSSLKPLEIRLSYPEEVFAMDLHRCVKFNNLDYVEGQKVCRWPSTIVLRYRNWESATFGGDQVRSESFTPDHGEVHRKFGISYWLEAKDNCESTKLVKPDGESSSPAKAPVALASPRDFQHAMDEEASQYWKSVLSLVKFKYQKIPWPVLAAGKDDKKHRQPEIGDTGVITRNELTCLPYIASPRAQGAKLVASAAGSAGVYIG